MKMLLEKSIVTYLLAKSWKFFKIFNHGTR